ncbi:MBL fold metallo-hydrolase [Aureimonas glaciei]|uniref:Phosphoribosyl 1,2-cyclic phosphodiesterase n=1 Tax=Aureimonas glaciei TaxID=1776957 RepID=A0A916Y035_9HYPH|nr:MBL fold metallo-hydrolase [Aureimonas glaciei]GGD24636.1 phosphoribosyl 1,2-cyclic phosphodiesterase [Aureimonas glaciei]
MSDTLRLTILGCGSSPGTPRITGDWGACDPAEPRNRRSRSSALIERVSGEGTTTVVIDCGPDFRLQMLAAQVSRLDAVLITHPHADHIHGLDDLRGYNQDSKALIPVHSDAATHARLLEAFGYCYRTPTGSDYRPIVRHVPIEPNEVFAVDGPGGPLSIRAFRQVHGSIHSLGFRIGPLAYCTDVSDFPPAAVEAIEGAEHIVIDALQYRPHPSHLSLDQALDWIARLKVGRATLTHMHTPLDYATLCAALPAQVRPGHDGLRLEFPVD